MGSHSEQNRPDPFEEQEKARTRLDLLVIALVCSISYYVLSGFDAFESVTQWSRTVEKWNVDELFMVSSIALIGSGVFIYRRWKQLEREVDRRRTLERRLAALEGLVPICSYCKSLRGESGTWTSIESLLKTDYQLEFTHGVCPSCKKTYLDPELSAFVEDRPQQDDT